MSVSVAAQNSITADTPSISPAQLVRQDGEWGSNFWVTLVDPQTQASFYACPATGQVSWDPPTGNFLLPPNPDGQWYELQDESRGGLSYYHHSGTGETVWTRPEGFVIPLGIIQNTALGRRLSNRVSKSIPNNTPHNHTASHLTPESPSSQRSKSYANDQNQNGRPTTKRSSPQMRRANTSDPYCPPTHGQSLPPIPASPYATDASAPSSPSSVKAPVTPTTPTSNSRPKEKDSPSGKNEINLDSTPPRIRSKSSSHVPHRLPPPQSLNAAVELLTSSQSEVGHGSTDLSDTDPRPPRISISVPPTPTQKPSRSIPPSPRRPIPATPQPGIRTRNISTPLISRKEISAPILNPAATLQMSPVKNRATGKPIPVPRSTSDGSGASVKSGIYHSLPHDLASDIQLFSESAYAKQYFSTHRKGFIFRRRVPVTQLMTWQKAPLGSPLLALNKTLTKDAVRVFKVIQHLMGDRERERPLGLRYPSEHVSAVSPISSSPISPSSTNALLEEERWLLGAGIIHGELRDEIYCQLMKQLSGNPSTESVFKGWQLMCVLLITFPPSKNFETYLDAFINKHTTQQEGRIDVMAKYCTKRLTLVSRKGPRGKPPTVAEIETASDAAFNPSTFGESLDAIVRLQERTYPQMKVPIILPFLADGILALGGTKSEGIFRVPGDGDSVAELKVRIDRGFYSLDGVDDPHILASLMKLWLRELCDPLVPEEMYNECITNSQDPTACVGIIERLPTINRRVVLFVVSFLQLFLEERTQSITKMTPANLALVMAPNVLRCNSDSMSVVFTNAQYEQIFVYHLLLHLKAGDVDPDYTPAHGLGAVPATAASRPSKSKNRR